METKDGDYTNDLEMKRYKYSTIAMVIVFIIFTFMDVLKSSLSDEAMMMFSIYMFVDSSIKYKYLKKPLSLIVAVVMLAIFIMFLASYIKI